MRDLLKNPLAFFLGAAREQGDIACYRPAPEPAYLINHPDFVGHVLRSNWANYSKETYSNRMFRLAVGDGILTSEGDQWKRERRAMQPYFHKRRVAQWDHIVTGQCQRMLERWGAEAAGGRPVNIAREMSLLTLSITLEALFSVTKPGIAEVIGTAVDQGLAVLERPRRPQLREARHTIAEVIDEIVADRERTAQPPDDLLSAIWKLSLNSDREELQRRAVRDQVFTVLVAAHETTASALTWTWVLLSEHPPIQRSLQAEVSNILDNRPPAAADLGKLRLVRMVFEESLRLYPPAWVIGRKALSADRLDGSAIPEHSIVAVSPYVMHRNAAYWERIDEFDPYRFEAKAAEKRPELAYIPFGAGPRNCLGENLAMLEAVLIIASVAQRFRPKLVTGQPIEPQPLFVLRPPTTLWMTLEDAQ